MKSNKTPKNRTNILKSNFIKTICLSLILLFALTSKVDAQKKDATMALLKSIVLPGWGHAGLGKEYKTRAYIHMGADIALLLSYWGVNTSTQRLQQNLYAHVEINAQTSIKNRDRAYKLAVGQFSSLGVYNEYQERNRNWNSFITDNSQNRWQWNSIENQADYIKMTNTIDSNNQQLPFIVTAMVANRIISGISAFISARELNANQTTTVSVQPVNTTGQFSGLALYVSIGL